MLKEARQHEPLTMLITVLDKKDLPARANQTEQCDDIVLPESLVDLFGACIYDGNIYEIIAKGEPGTGGGSSSSSCSSSCSGGGG